MKNIELMREYMRLVEAGEKEPHKHFEVYLSSLNKWVSMGDHHWFSMGPYKFRLKQRTININGFEVPEPEREELHYLDVYYIPLIEEGDYFGREWNDTDLDITYLNAGMVHLTEEAAIQHAKALLSFTEVKHDD